MAHIEHLPHLRGGPFASGAQPVVPAVNTTSVVATADNTLVWTFDTVVTDVTSYGNLAVSGVGATGAVINADAHEVTVTYDGGSFLSGGTWEVTGAAGPVFENNGRLVQTTGSITPIIQLVGSMAGANNAGAANLGDITGANLIVVALSGYGVGAGAISDSEGNTYTALTKYTNADNNNVQLFYKVNPTTGNPHTVTATHAGGYYSFVGASFNLANSTPFDLEAGANGGPGTSCQAGSLTPSQTLALVVAAVVDLGTSHTINGSFTAASVDYVGGSHVACGLAYKTLRLAEANNPTWSWTGSSKWAAAIASFKHS